MYSKSTITHTFSAIESTQAYANENSNSLYTINIYTTDANGNAPKNKREREMDGISLIMKLVKFVTFAYTHT